VQGRLLSLHDDVILNNNMINRPGCYTPPPNTKGHDKSHTSRELAAMAEDTERYAAVAG
jgi:hypothetical protein